MKLVDVDELIKSLTVNQLDCPGCPEPEFLPELIEILKEAPEAELSTNNSWYKIILPPKEKYEYHYDHTDCIYYSSKERHTCPSTCAQYRDGWNDAMQYIFRGGDGYRPYRRDEKYEE